MKGRSFISTLIAVVGVLLCLVVVGAVLFPLFARATGGGRTACLSNMKQCATAVRLYAEDHDDRLPPALSWMDATRQVAQTDYVFACPDLARTNPQSYGYAMNLTVSDVNTALEDQPADTVLLFESVLLARNACSGFYGLPDPPRHGGNCVAFLDGHVARIIPVLVAEFGPDGRKKP